MSPAPSTSEDDRRVRAWHTALRAVAVVNVLAFVVVATRIGGATDYTAAQISCSGIFVAVCAYRSWFPMVYAPGFALVDAWPSNVFLTRVAATVAELCLIAQLAWLLHALGAAAGSGFAQLASAALVPLVAGAQVCCWYGVATRRSVGELCEESLWTLALAIAFAGFVHLAWVGGLRPTVAVGLVGIGVYLGFMTLSALPMYAERTRDERSGSEALGLTEGLRDMAERRVLTTRWRDWAPEMAWMSLYFGPWVWLSITMIAVEP